MNKILVEEDISVNIVINLNYTDTLSFLKVVQEFDARFINIDIWKRKMQIEYPDFFQVNEEASVKRDYKTVYCDVSTFAPEHSNRYRNWYTT